MNHTAEKSIIFIHIPKTAGTTLRTILEGIYDENEICKLYHDNDYSGFDAFKKLTDEEKRKKKIFVGHVQFGLHREIPQACQYITVLRNPMYAFISYHNFMKNTVCDDPNVQFRDVWEKAAAMSIDEFANCDFTKSISNWQVCYLSNRPMNSGAQATRQDLEDAKENLRKYFLLGLTERFDESITLMKRVLGWRIPFYFSWNVSKNKKPRKEIQENTLKIIAEKNNLDLELYTFAVDLFNKQVGAQGTSFVRELDELRHANTYIANLIATKNAEKDAAIKQVAEQTMKQTAEDVSMQFRLAWSWRLTAPIRKAADLMKRSPRLEEK